MVLQDEVNDLQLRLSAIDTQLHSIASAAQPTAVSRTATGLLGGATPATPAVASTQAALGGLLDSTQALEEQVEVLTQRCSDLGTSNEELRCVPTTVQQSQSAVSF